MFGYTSFNELHRVAGSMPHTLGDAFVDEPERQIRRERHINVLIQAGVDRRHAEAAVDAIGPTNYGASQCRPWSNGVSDFESR